MTTRFFLAICLVFSLALSLCFAGGPQGFGQVLSISTTSAQAPTKNYRKVSVYNSGSTEVVFALVNISVADFDVKYAAGETIAIPPGVSYQFTMDDGDKRAITNIVYRSDSGTPTGYLACF